MRLSKKLVIAALGSATLVLNSVAAFAAGPTIEDTEGPLVRIAISDKLNCSINYQGDRYNEFYNGRSPGRRSRKRSQERVLKPIRGSSRLSFAAVDSRSRRRTPTQRAMTSTRRPRR